MHARLCACPPAFFLIPLAVRPDSFHAFPPLPTSAGKTPGGAAGGEVAQAGGVPGAGVVVRAGGGVASGALRVLDLFGCSINYDRRGAGAGR